MKQAEIIIIGGGVMGCSLAYHLCKEGVTDVILLEKSELTSGSTWHAAGQVTHSVSNQSIAKMASYASKLYTQLEEETGQSCSWHDCGSLRFAYTEEEIDWIYFTLSLGKGLGLEMDIIGCDDIAKIHPFYNLEGIKAALYTPDDGHVDPAGVTFAMAAGARKMGAKIIRQNRATGISQGKNGDGWIVHTEQGDFACQKVVNAGGTYARQIGQWVGLDLPIANLLHHYLITENVPEFENLEKELPVVRDDSQISGYLRMEQKSALIGIYEKANAATVWDDETPWSEENTLFDPDYDRIMPWLENSMERMPILADLGIKRVVHGALTHPVDGNMLLGPSGIKDFWLCCGSHIGIAWGPGAGKALAQWMVHGSADISMNSFDPRRFGAKIDDKYRIEKGKEDYYFRHVIPYPHLDRPALRPSHSKFPPIYESLKAKGAVFQDIYGWERPFWYARNGVKQEHIHSFKRSELDDIIGQEVTILREHAGITDLSCFAKIDIKGTDSVAFLNRISSNKLPQKDGSIMLTYLVNPNGRIECEITLMRLAENHYYAVYASMREKGVLNWLETQKQPEENVEFDNLSEQYGVLVLAGPKARNILQQITNIPLDNASFRWLSGQVITLCGVDNTRVMRVTYTGELGYEIHIPMDGLQEVFEQLFSATEAAGGGMVGMAAYDVVRMEKAYKSGHELTNEVTLAEAEVTRFARETGFQGAEKTLTKPKKWVLVYLKITAGTNGYADLGIHQTTGIYDAIGQESLWHGDKPIGFMTSGAYSHVADAFLAWGYVKPEYASAGDKISALCFGVMRDAEILSEPVFDVNNARARSN